MVDGSGRVVAMVFAAVTGPSAGHGGFAVPTSLIRQQLALAATRTNPVSTQKTYLGERRARNRMPGTPNRERCPRMASRANRPRNPVDDTPWADGGLQHRPPLGVYCPPTSSAI